MSQPRWRRGQDRMDCLTSWPLPSGTNSPQRTCRSLHWPSFAPSASRGSSSCAERVVNSSIFCAVRKAMPSLSSAPLARRFGTAPSASAPPLRSACGSSGGTSTSCPPIRSAKRRPRSSPPSRCGFTSWATSRNRCPQRTNPDSAEPCAAFRGQWGCQKTASWAPEPRWRSRASWPGDSVRRFSTVSDETSCVKPEARHGCAGARPSDGGCGGPYRGPPRRAMSVKGKKVGFVGAGNMGEALIRGLVESNLVPPDKILVADVRADRVHQLADQYGLRAVASNASLVSAADVVILAVKPQIMAPVLREAMPALTNRPLLISIAAGVSTATIQSIIGKYPRLIRVMPNTPALVLQGVTAIARAPGLEQDDLETAQEIFAAVGRAVVLDEEQMDAVTGLSGSGPAYVALVIEALADGGVKMGLDRATAMTLATQTVLGAAKLLAETGMHPAALKDMVSSPGGTTIAGIAALEEGDVRTTFIRAVERATLRSRELGRGPA